VLEVDLDRLEQVEEALALAFYVLMFMALVMGLAGSTGSALLLLIVGACAHIGRASLGEFAERERAGGPPRALQGADVPTLRRRAKGQVRDGAPLSDRAAAGGRAAVRLRG
jgi:hypothetical protein